ncbi:MAG: SufE family protein [Halofilum sp. (in: g-proteobacteria)]|nr:SufE family protein [Halofilum sp. (in: g-proteobacteria)]
MSIDRIITAFEMLPSWQDRYRLIIDQGRTLPELPEEERVDENLLDGCMSKVWLTAHSDDSQDPPVIHFHADSDSQIVKGLIAIVFEVFNGRTPEEIVTTDIESVFSQLELEQHLSSGRRNGLSSMVRRIRELAQQELAA